MEITLLPRDNEYLNNEDVYLCYDAGIKNLFLSKLSFDRGFWWTDESLKYKVSTILVQNTNELYHNEITYKGLPYKGSVTKFLTPKNIGVIWDSGKQIKTYGLAPFWNHLTTLELNLE